MTYISLKGYVGQFKRECTDILKVVITIENAIRLRAEAFFFFFVRIEFLPFALPSDCVQL